MNCPLCKSNLRKISYEGVSIETCDTCGGEFVGGEQLAHIVKMRDEKFGSSVMDEVSTLKPTFAVAAQEFKRSLECPACRSDTRPINYSGDTGVVLDRCTACSGLWLDRSELEKIQALLEKWEGEAPAKVRLASGDIRQAQERARARAVGAFRGSRFSFVNAVINRLLDAA